MDLQNTEGKSMPSGKIDLKIVAGLVIVALLLVYILVRLFFFVSGQSANTFEKTLSSYYQSLAKNDTNAAAQITTTDFIDEMGAFKLTPGRYEVYAYRYEKLDSDKNSAADTNNPGGSISRITYSLSFMEDKMKVSYLLESYMVQENGHPRLQYIKKIFKGKNIAL